MKLLPLLKVLLIAALPSTATVIQESVTCQAGTVTRQEVGSCHIFAASAEAYATADVFAAHSSNQLTVRAISVAGASGYDSAATSSARSRASLMDEFTTDGPERVGWIDLNMSFSFDFAGGSAGAGAAVGPYSGGLGTGSMTGRFVFVLGHPFAVDVWSGSGAHLSGFGGVFGLGSAFLSFSLFEADGVTTVRLDPLSELPEPNPTHTAAAAISAALVLRLTQRRRRRHPGVRAGGLR